MPRKSCIPVAALALTGVGASGRPRGHGVDPVTHVRGRVTVRPAGWPGT